MGGKAAFEKKYLLSDDGGWRFLTVLLGKGQGGNGRVDGLARGVFSRERWMDGGMGGDKWWGRWRVDGCGVIVFYLVSGSGLGGSFGLGGLKNCTF